MDTLKSLFWLDTDTETSAGRAARGTAWALAWVAYLNGRMVMPFFLGGTIHLPEGADVQLVLFAGAMGMSIAAFLALVSAHAPSRAISWIALVWTLTEVLVRLAWVASNGISAPFTAITSVLMLFAAISGVRGASALATLAKRRAQETEPQPARS